MNKHDHDTCAHKQIKFCGRCDEFYCEGCDAQWAKPCTQNHYPYYWTYQPISTGSPYMTGPYYGATDSASGIRLDVSGSSLRIREGDDSTHACATIG